MFQQKINSSQSTTIDSQLSSSISQQTFLKLCKLENQLNNSTSLELINFSSLNRDLEQQLIRLKNINNHKIKSQNRSPENIVLLSIIKRVGQLHPNKENSFLQQTTHKEIIQNNSNQSNNNFNSLKLKRFCQQQFPIMKKVQEFLKQQRLNQAFYQMKKMSSTFYLYQSQKSLEFLASYLYQPIIQGLIQKIDNLKKQAYKSLFSNNNFMQRVQSVEIMRNSQFQNENQMPFQLSAQTIKKVDSKSSQNNHLNFEKAKSQDNSLRLFQSIRHRIDQVNKLSEKMSKIKDDLLKRPQCFTKKNTHQFNKTFQF